MPDINNNTGDLFGSALLMEKNGDLVKAAALYENILKGDKFNEKVLGRLMLIYRKLKKYKKEIICIEKVIKIQEKFYQPKKQEKRGEISLLSKKINLILGHTDRKGNKLHIPEILIKLNKRKENVLRKINDENRTPKN